MDDMSFSFLHVNYDRDLRRGLDLRRFDFTFLYMMMDFALYLLPLNENIGAFFFSASFLT